MESQPKINLQRYKSFDEFYNQSLNLIQRSDSRTLTATNYLLKAVLSDAKEANFSDEVFNAATTFAAKTVKPSGRSSSIRLDQLLSAMSVYAHENRVDALIDLPWDTRLRLLLQVSLQKLRMDDSFISCTRTIESDLGVSIFTFTLRRLAFTAYGTALLAMVPSVKSDTFYTFLY
jgi:hypothetical protein